MSQKDNYGGRPCVFGGDRPCVFGGSREPAVQPTPQATSVPSKVPHVAVPHSVYGKK